jgi:hypothetical protein
MKAREKAVKKAGGVAGLSPAERVSGEPNGGREKRSQAFADAPLGVNVSTGVRVRSGGGDFPHLNSYKLHSILNFSEIGIASRS